MQPLESFGGPRSGYFEIVTNPRAIWYAARTSKINTANPLTGREEFVEGEWAIEDANDELNKSSSGNPEVASWPIVRGKEMTDTGIASGTYTIVIGSGFRARTNGFNVTVGGITEANYTYGAELTVESGVLTPAVTGEFIHAIVIKGPETLTTGAERAIGKTGFRVITVEIGPRGYKA